MSAAEDAPEEAGPWRQVEPDDDLARFEQDVLVQWQDPDDRIAVYIEEGEHSVGDREGEPFYSASSSAVTQSLMFTSKSLARRESTFETALDAAVDYMERTDPGVPLPTFTLRMTGGMLKPLMEFVHRLGASAAKFTVRDDGVRVESVSFHTGVDFFISREMLDEYEVEREGEFTIDVDDLWTPFGNIKFGDMVPMSLDADAERPQLGIGPFSTRIKWGVSYTERTFPEIADADFEFTVDGLNFSRVKGVITQSDDDLPEFETAALGVQDGVALLHTESDPPGEELTVRFDATDVRGEGFVSLDLEPLREFERALPRPSQNDVTFRAAFDKPILVHSTVSERDRRGPGVDVRIVLADEAIPVEITVPPEEIVVPEEEPEPPEAPEAPEPPEVPEPSPEIEAEVREVLEAKPAHRTTDLSELPGIGRATAERVREETAVDSLVSTVRTAYEMRDERDTWDEIIGLMPSERAREALVAAVRFEPPEPEEPAFTLGEIETIVEQATVGVEVDTFAPGGTFQEIRMMPEPGAPVAFDGDPDRITAGTGDPPAEAIRTALARWAEFVRPETVSEAEREDINMRRQELTSQFAIDLPAYEPVVAPAEAPEEARADGYTESDLEDIITESVAGAVADTTINPAANSLRTEWIIPDEDDVEFADRPGAAFGQPNAPVQHVEDALRKWEQAVDLTTVDIDAVDAEREQVETEFDIALPDVAEPTPEEVAGPRTEAEEAFTGEYLPDSVSIDVTRRLVEGAESPGAISEAEVETDIARQLEPTVLEETEGIYTDIFMEAEFGPDGRLRGVVIGGIPSAAGEDRLAGFPIIDKESAGTVDVTAIPSEIAEAVDNLIELTHVLDTERGKYPTLHRKLDTIGSVTEFAIKRGQVDYSDLFLTREEARPVTAVAPTFYEDTILEFMLSHDPAWWAAQQIFLFETGATGTEPIIQQNIESGHAPHVRDMLRMAYEESQEGRFEAETFLRNYWGVAGGGGRTPGDIVAVTKREEERRAAAIGRGPVEVALDEFARPTFTFVRDPGDPRGLAAISPVDDERFGSGASSTINAAMISVDGRADLEDYAEGEPVAAVTFEAGVREPEVVDIDVAEPGGPTREPEPDPEPGPEPEREPEGDLEEFRQDIRDRLGR